MVPAIYDNIGTKYSSRRSADPAISSAIAQSLGTSKSVINVGAGTGSYEPNDRFVLAIEPSMLMIKQRQSTAGPVVQGCAEALPVASGSFDAALAILTIHHWSDVRAGLKELMRAARERVVILTWDPCATDFWLYEYFPEIAEIDIAIFPAIDEIEGSLGNARRLIVPIRHDCVDGFLGAYWRHPDRYLDPDVRSGISTFCKIRGVDSGARRLESDLHDGTWNRKHGHILREASLDLGYRLLLFDD